MNSVFLGLLPDGRQVYVTPMMAAMFGVQALRRDLVDSEWLRHGMTPKGYHWFRTSLNPRDKVLVYGPTYEEARQKFLRSVHMRDYSEVIIEVKKYLRRTEDALLEEDVAAALRHTLTLLNLSLELLGVLLVKNR